MDSGLSSRINLVILDGAHDFRSTFNTGSDEICKQVRLVALFGRDRRVGECLLLREERKSGLRGPISVFDPTRTSRVTFFAPCGGPSNSSKAKGSLIVPPQGANLTTNSVARTGGHMRRREFIGHLSVIGAAAASTLFGQGSSAQSVPKRPLIAWAGAAPPGVKTPQFIVDLTFGNFVKGLLEFGYEQGRNIDIIRRTDIFRDRVPSIEEMVALVKPDIIAAPATLEAVAARKATSTIPIVCAALAEAVHLGLIASEARPGGNVTGIEPYIAGLPTKQIELAREIAPTARRVGPRRCCYSSPTAMPGCCCL